MKKILLIDGNQLVYKGFYAKFNFSKETSTTSSGIPTSAIPYVYRTLKYIITNRKSTHVLVAFDAAKHTRRHDIFPDYKGKRPKSPVQLIKQFSLIKQMVSLMGIKWFELKDWEADDIIATMSVKAANKKYEVEILSSDKDLFQLINKKTIVLFHHKGIRKLKEINNNIFFEINGHYPGQVTDIKGIAGDQSDNLPGIKGIGIKGANKLLGKYKTLENIYNNIDKITESLKIKLEKDKHVSIMCKKLATLNTNLKIPIHLNQTMYKSIITKDLMYFFEKYELKFLINNS